MLNEKNKSQIPTSYLFQRVSMKRFYYFQSAAYANINDFPQAYIYFKLAIKKGWNDLEGYQKDKLFDQFRSSSHGKDILQFLLNS
jgi:hypothetical protein